MISTDSKGNISSNIEFLVIKPDKEFVNKHIIPVLGLATCEQFELIKRIDMLSSEKEQFIIKNIDIFTGLGKFPEPYKIQLKENAKPKPAPYRRVPQTIRERLIIKLKDLIEKGTVFISQLIGLTTQ